MRAIVFIMFLLPSYALALPIDYLKLLSKKNYVAAESAIEQNLKSNPKDGLLWFNLAQTRRVLNKRAGALTAFEEVIQLNSALSKAAQVYKFQLLREEGLKKRAYFYWETKLKNETFPAALNATLTTQVQLLQKDFTAQALALYQKNRLQSALQWARFANKMGSDADNLALMGVILDRMNLDKLSLLAFRKSYRAARATGQQSFVKKIYRYSREQDPSPRSLNLDAGVFYDSDLFADTLRQENVATQGQYVQADLTQEFSESDISLSLSGGWTGYREVAAANNHNYGAEFSWGPSHGAWKWLVAPSFNQEYLDNEPSIRNSNLFLQMAREQSEWSSGILGQYQYADPENDTDEPGELGRAGFFATRFLPKKRYLRLELTAEHQDYSPVTVGTLILPRGYKGAGQTASYFMPVGQSGRLLLMLQSLRRIYWSTIKPYDEEVKDHFLRVETSYWYRLGKITEVYISGEYFRNRSTIPETVLNNVNEDKWTLTIGAQWGLNF